MRGAGSCHRATTSLVAAVSLATVLMLTACSPVATTSQASRPTGPGVSAADQETHGTIDSGRILFGVDGQTDSGKPELRVLQGSELQTVVTGDPTFSHAAWAGGDAIVYDSEPAQGRQVFRRADFRDASADLLAPEAVAGGANAGVSPDGSLVVFAASMPFEGRRMGLSVVSVDTGEAVEITPQGPEKVLIPYDDFPSFSPDARQVVYLRVTTASEQGDALAGAVFVVDVNGGTPRRVSPDLQFPGPPRFSPDGTQILYHANPSEWKTSLWVVPVSGGEPTELFAVPSHAHAMNPDWSPDGTKLVFEWAEDGPDRNELRISNLDGSDTRTIWQAASHARAEHPDWAD